MDPILLGLDSFDEAQNRHQVQPRGRDPARVLTAVLGLPKGPGATDAVAGIPSARFWVSRDSQSAAYCGSP